MGTDKALLPWPPQVSGQPQSCGTFLSEGIRTLAFSTDFVIVVAGANQRLLAPVVYACGAAIVANPDPARGQFSSLQLGVQEVLNRGRDAAILMLVDRPPAAHATVEALRKAFVAAPDHIWAVVPEFSGKHGHPLIAGRELMGAFLEAPANGNAREIEHEYQSHIQYVPVNDPFTAMNVNTPAEYSALIQTVT